ncbi:MAG: hypothetical protein NC417_01815 [Candidatus Gastranaerophilales bacterium]|nr:hypothetical protein [Candidatus Gastranaerophilales bacterium]
MSRNYNAASNTILQELEKIKDVEINEGICTPIPNYLYIQRYGRSAQEQMDQILTKIGKKDWFLFKTGEQSEEKKLIEKFDMDLHRHADTGKEYTGCSLIELSKETLGRDELPEFLEYLKENERQLYCLFTIKNAGDAVSAQKCIEQYFFTRIVYAEEFSVEEQFDIIRDTCEEYGFGIARKERIGIMRGLEDRKWKADEQVAFLLQNAARSVIYEAMLEDQAKKRLISAELSERLLSKLQKTTEKERILGFQPREVEKREEYQYE